MNTWFTSDNHFGHANSIKYCNRPFKDCQEMDETMIRLWNENVKPGDTVWTLGDFAFLKLDKIENLIRRLNGNIHITLGNHDQEIRKNRRRLLDEGFFKEIVDYKELKMDGQHLVLCHYPMRQWNRSHHGAYQLFGHVHGGLEPLNTSVDVGVDSTWVTGTAPYKPFHYDEIVRFMKKQTIGTHHE